MSTGDRQAHRVALTMKQDRRPVGLLQRRDRPAIRFVQLQLRGVARRDRHVGAALLAWDHRFCIGGVLKHATFKPIPGTINCIDRNGAVSNLLGIMIVGLR